jgi:polyhydroxyalkanoate synthesis regulator phasin
MAGLDSSPRQLLSELALAAVGAVALTTERIDALAEAMMSRGPITSVEEARAFLREQTERWREDAARAGAQASSWAGALAHELGLLSREEADELDLRVAQLEHRVHLLEQENDSHTGRARDQ